MQVLGKSSPRLALKIKIIFQRDTSRPCLRAWKIASVSRVVLTCGKFSRTPVLHAPNPSPRGWKKGGKVHNSEYSISFTQICQK